MKIRLKTILKLLSLLFLVLSPISSSAGIFELGAGFSFARKKYEGASYTWSRSWNTSLAYHFNERSGLEFSYMNETEKTNVEGYYTTTIRDQVYSISWVQFLMGRTVPIQPYFKVGAGQLYRNLERSYIDGIEVKSKVTSLSGVLALGLKIAVSQRMGLNLQGVTYLSDFDVTTWEDNVGLNFGLSVFF